MRFSFVFNLRIIFTEKVLNLIMSINLKVNAVNFVNGWIEELFCFVLFP